MDHTSQAQTVYIALGANLGDPLHTLNAVCEHLRQLPNLTDCVVSPFYRSKPFEANGPDYINGVMRFSTDTPALELLNSLQILEQQFGRERLYRNAPRTLDLDILLYGTEQIHHANLNVPHPRMHLRAFVLKPLQDIAPTLKLAQGSLDALLGLCQDQVLTPV